MIIQSSGIKYGSVEPRKCSVYWVPVYYTGGRCGVNKEGAHLVDSVNMLQNKGFLDFMI